MGTGIKCKFCKNSAYLTDEDVGRYLWCFEFEEDLDEDIVVTPCHAYKPKTNADVIRNMSDEELAEFFNKLEYESVVYGNGLFSCSMDSKRCGESCTPCYVEWLQKEVE
jgi:hypothetical protein